MRIATAPHHTNPRSATLDFWRKERIPTSTLPWDLRMGFKAEIQQLKK